MPVGMENVIKSYSQSQIDEVCCEYDFLRGV